MTSEWLDSSAVYCFTCDAPAGWHCGCGSVLRVVKLTRRKVASLRDRQRARMKNPRPNRNMLTKLLPAFSGNVGVLVDIAFLETHELAVLRAAGYIHRKRRGTPRQRARRKRRLVRYVRYFSSEDGLAQATELKLLRIENEPLASYALGEDP